MPGIYIHVPFCKTRCIYCDFYSTTRDDLKRRYVQALCKELKMRRDYLKGAPVETVYFGGGTPSQLDEEDLATIFDTLQEVYGLEHVLEITFEANPDDLTESYLAMLRNFPINRVSMGIQTFDDATLRLLHRRHTSQEAKEAVRRCKEAGLRNVSIDLIYGLPGETEEMWANDLNEALSLRPHHLSAYLLTYEEGTPLYRMRADHQVNEVDEDLSLLFFQMLADTMKGAGFIHYELSNFCRPGRQSRHNTSYWRGTPYLGCGPSAHSFDTVSREWNSPSLMDYITQIERGERPYGKETLTPDMRYNEYVMTGLRTIWGISIYKIRQQFGSPRLRYLERMAAPHIGRGTMVLRNGHLKLTEEGFFVSDDIISDLMYIG